MNQTDRRLAMLAQRRARRMKKRQEAIHVALRGQIGPAAWLAYRANPDVARLLEIAAAGGDVRADPELLRRARLKMTEIVDAAGGRDLRLQSELLDAQIEVLEAIGR